MGIDKIVYPWYTWFRLNLNLLEELEMGIFGLRAQVAHDDRTKVLGPLLCQSRAMRWYSLSMHAGYKYGPIGS